MTEEKPKHKLWVRVVEVHAAKTWIAIILATCAGLALVVIAVGAVWNTVANPEVTDLAGNYNTLLSGAFGVIFGGLVGFLGASVQQTKEASPGEVPGDEDLVLDVNDPSVKPPKPPGEPKPPPEPLGP